MDQILVRGGRRLCGDVSIGGAKNAALPLIASTLLGPQWGALENLPDVADVRTMVQLLDGLGARTRREGNHLWVNTDSVHQRNAPYSLVRTMRASILVLGPLVARWGEAIVPLPGGCAIGSRPVNLHLDGLRALGAEVSIRHGNVCVKARRLKGAPIVFDRPTVTGTENLMMAAVLADGVTEIHNAAREPEVVDLANALIKRGARIAGCGTSTITVHGVHALHDGVPPYRVMDDRMEAGTYMVAAALTRGDVTIRINSPAHLTGISDMLQETGAETLRCPEGIRVRMTRRPRPVNVTTAPCPGFPTDLQAQIATLLTLAEGVSVVTETVFENRLTHVSELRRMGANITINGNQATITGVDRLSGAPVMASDLRAGAALILAGLVANGETTVSRVYHVDRGYECIETKLAVLGANVRRVGYGSE